MSCTIRVTMTDPTPLTHPRHRPGLEHHRLRRAGSRATTARLLVEAGVVRGPRAATLASRLGEIHQGVAEVMPSFQPAVMALEELYSHYERPRTAILMGHARGVICLAAARPASRWSLRGHPDQEDLTGSGRAAKVADCSGRSTGNWSWPQAPGAARRGRRPGHRPVPPVPLPRTAGNPLLQRDTTRHDHQNHRQLDCPGGRPTPQPWHRTPSSTRC